MEKMSVDYFRTYPFRQDKSKIPNIDFITELLKSKNITRKTFGLCAEPFDKYYTICNKDDRGVSSVKVPLNLINVTVNYNTSTRKKRIYFYSLEIYYIKEFYYICCLAQSPFYKKSFGAEHITYKVDECEIEDALDEIFLNVES